MPPFRGESVTSFERPTAPEDEINIDSTKVTWNQPNTKKDDDKDDKEDKYADAKPIPFLALFRHGTPKDKLIIFVGIVVQACVGLSFSAMNLVFGEVIDDLSAPSTSVLESTIGTIKVMAILACVFGAAAFIGMSAIPYGAARITNRVRNAYITAVLGQDMSFFDESKPGEIVAALAEYTMDFEEGLSIKLGEGLQATFGAVGGLVVALYFSWQITVSVVFICMHWKYTSFGTLYISRQCIHLCSSMSLFSFYPLHTHICIIQKSSSCAWWPFRSWLCHST